VVYLIVDTFLLFDSA